MATMKSLVLYVALLTSSASAQLLQKGIGTLPTCAHTCSILLNSQNTCNGGNTLALSAWECFCQAVYTSSGSNPAAICPTTCGGSDDTLVEQWFTANCGSDNGASEHDGSSSPTTTASPSGSAAAGAGGAGSTASGVPADDGVAQSNCTGSWFHCHYQWIIMIIVVAIGLIALGFGGRWLKRRHDRRRDQIRGGFNDGITSRGMNNDKAIGPVGARDSPARTRDNFMPYGYGYSRGGGDGSTSEIERGGTPIEMEKQQEQSGGSAREKLKRVLVRDGRR